MRRCMCVCVCVCVCVGVGLGCVGACVRVPVGVGWWGWLRACVRVFVCGLCVRVRSCVGLCCVC